MEIPAPRGDEVKVKDSTERVVERVLRVSGNRGTTEAAEDAETSETTLLEKRFERRPQWIFMAFIPFGSNATSVTL
jgi:hypothetical protein